MSPLLSSVSVSGPLAHLPTSSVASTSTLFKGPRALDNFKEGTERVEERTLPPASSAHKQTTNTTATYTYMHACMNAYKGHVSSKAFAASNRAEQQMETNKRDGKCSKSAGGEAQQCRCRGRKQQTNAATEALCLPCKYTWELCKRAKWL